MTRNGTIPDRAPESARGFPQVVLPMPTSTVAGEGGPFGGKGLPPYNQLRFGSQAGIPMPTQGAWKRR